ncbi:hypothetical protein D3C76_581210 [compost metagenome]
MGPSHSSNNWLLSPQPAFMAICRPLSRPHAHGKPLPRAVQCPWQPRLRAGRNDRAHADFHDRHRPDHHALAVAGGVRFGRCRGGDVRAGHSVLCTAGVAAGGPFWSAPDLAGVSADRGRGAVDGAALHPFAGTTVDVVCVRRDRRLYAEHVSDGSGALDRALSRPAATANRLRPGVGAGRSLLHRRATLVGGVMRGGVPRGWAVGGVADAGDRGHGVRIATQHRAAGACP